MSTNEDLTPKVRYITERETDLRNDLDADLISDLRDLRELAAAVVQCRAKLLRAKEEESLRSKPSVRRVEDARFELACAIEALKTHLEDKP